MLIPPISWQTFLKWVGSDDAYAGDAGGLVSRGDDGQRRRADLHRVGRVHSEADATAPLTTAVMIGRGSRSTPRPITCRNSPSKQTVTRWTARSPAAPTATKADRTGSTAPDRALLKIPGSSPHRGPLRRAVRAARTSEARGPVSRPNATSDSASCSRRGAGSAAPGEHPQLILDHLRRVEQQRGPGWKAFEVEPRQACVVHMPVGQGADALGARKSIAASSARSRLDGIATS